MESCKIVAGYEGKNESTPSMFSTTDLLIGVALKAKGKDNFFIPSRTYTCRDQVLAEFVNAKLHKYPHWKTFSFAKPLYTFVAIHNQRNDVNSIKLKETKLANGLRVLNMVEEHFDINKTIAREVKFKEGGGANKFGARGYILEADRRWAKSVHMLSLYYLIFRIGVKSPKTKYNTFDEFSEMLKGKQATTHSDVGYISGTSYPVFEALLSNVDDIFKGITSRYVYSAARTKDGRPYHQKMHTNFVTAKDGHYKKSYLSSIGSAMGQDGFRGLTAAISSPKCGTCQMKILERVKSCIKK